MRSAYLAIFESSGVDIEKGAAVRPGQPDDSITSLTPPGLSPARRNTFHLKLELVPIILVKLLALATALVLLWGHSPSHPTSDSEGPSLVLKQTASDLETTMDCFIFSLRCTDLITDTARAQTFGDLHNVLVISFIGVICTSLHS